MKEFDAALRYAKTGRFEQAISILEQLAVEEPRNPDILYNLGMCYTELGRPDAAIRTLKQCVKWQPDYANGHVALGVAYSKSGDQSEAEKQLSNALGIEPENPYAHRNLGALYADQDKLEQAIEHFEHAAKYIPSDPQTNYGLGLAYFHQGQVDKADSYLKKVVATTSPAHIKGRAKDILRTIAEMNFRAKGYRPDAMFYCLSALKTFKGMSKDMIQKITFEIALKGRSGFDVNKLSRKYGLNSLPGEFSGLQLVCYMYVGFKEFAPEQDVGFDISREYGDALTLFRKGIDA